MTAPLSLTVLYTFLCVHILAVFLGREGGIPAVKSSRFSRRDWLEGWAKRGVHIKIRLRFNHFRSGDVSLLRLVLNLSKRALNDVGDRYLIYCNFDSFICPMRWSLPN